MRYFLAVSIIFGFCNLANAEQVTLTYEEAANILPALSALDSYEDIDNQQKMVKRFYKFSGSVRLAIAKDITALRNVLLVFRDAHNAKIQELTGGDVGNKEKQDSVAAAVNASDNEMSKHKQPIELDKIKIEDLGLDPPNNNPIPPSVIAGLNLILVAPKTQ